MVGLLVTHERSSRASSFVCGRKQASELISRRRYQPETLFCRSRSWQDALKSTTQVQAPSFTYMYVKNVRSGRTCVRKRAWLCVCARARVCPSAHVLVLAGRNAGERPCASALSSEGTQAASLGVCAHACAFVCLCVCGCVCARACLGARA